MNFGLCGIKGNPIEWEPSQGWQFYDDETRVWIARVITNGGTLTTRSAMLADNLIKTLKQTTFNNKVIWLAPFIGGNLSAAMVPLRDFLGAGTMVNPATGGTAMVETDFSELNGVVSTGSRGPLNTKIYPTQLSAFGGGNGILGLGYYELSANSGGGGLPIGSRNYATTEVYALTLFNGNFLRQQCQIGTAGWTVIYQKPIAVGTRMHWYGQRTSLSGIYLYADGSCIATRIPGDTITFGVQATINVVGANLAGSISRHSGRCGAAYLTRGDLTPDEIQDMHQLLVNFNTQVGR